MIIEWIGQVLGLRESSSSTGAPEPLRRSSVMDEPGPVSSVVDSPDLLHKELERARRYERGLSVSVLTVEPLDAVEGEKLDGDRDVRASAKASGPPQVVALLAAAGLRDMLRQSDVLCYQPTENRFVLALAESDAEASEKALVRISGIFRERLGLDIQAGISRFPDDALTLAGLIDSAASGGTMAGAGTGASMADHRATPSSAARSATASTVTGTPSAATGLQPEEESGRLGNGEAWSRSNGQRRSRHVTPLEVNDDE